MDDNRTKIERNETRIIRSERASDYYLLYVEDTDTYATGDKLSNHSQPCSKRSSVYGLRYLWFVRRREIASRSYVNAQDFAHSGDADQHI